MFMVISKFCGPAMIYFIFMLIHVIMAYHRGLKKGAFLQLLIGFLMTFLLQMLCIKQMTIVSWIIVFIPFIFYTYMTLVLYHVFGLDPESTTKTYEVPNPNTGSVNVDETRIREAKSALSKAYGALEQMNEEY